VAEELDGPLQVLRGCGEQDLVPGAAQAAQSKSIEPENALPQASAAPFKFSGVLFQFGSVSSLE